MTTITTVEARTVAVPLPATVAFSGRSVGLRYYTLVRVRGDDGVTGIGFAYAGHAAGALTTEAVRTLLAPRVVGDDAHRVSGIWEDLYRETLLHGRAGVVTRALSALDIALWDRNARAAGLPLSKLLGAARIDRVPAYASGGYYQEGKTPADLAREASAYVALGFRAVKIKMGRLSPTGDGERFAAVREAVGPEVLVMLDANNAWSDVPSALRALRAWERWDPYWIEEPFGPDDLRNHARLARETHIPVATGEIMVGRWQHEQLVREGGALILQTDAAVCGGITEWLRIAGLAASSGLRLAPHWFHDLHAQLVAATPCADWVEYFPDDKVFNFRSLITPQLRVEGGSLVLPGTPGLGFDFDDAAVERFAQDGWR